MDNVVVHVRTGRYGADEHPLHSDLIHPIRLNHFDCAGNGLALDDQFDSIPVQAKRRQQFINLSAYGTEALTFIECVDILGTMCDRSR